MIIYYLHTNSIFLCFGRNLITQNTGALDCFPVCIQVDALVSYFCLFKSLKFLVGPSTFIPIHSIPITHSIPSSADFKLQILLSWGFIVPERSLKMLTCPHSRLQCQNKNTRLWIYIAVNWLVCHHSVKTDTVENRNYQWKYSVYDFYSCNKEINLATWIYSLVCTELLWMQDGTKSFWWVKLLFWGFQVYYFFSCMFWVVKLYKSKLQKIEIFTKVPIAEYFLHVYYIQRVPVCFAHTS